MSVNAVHTDPASPESKKAESSRLKKACTEFEAMFINQMLKAMRESDKAWKEQAGEDGLGLGTDNPYQDMFDWQLAVRLSERSPLGIARELTRMMEKRMGIAPEDEELVPEIRRIQTHSAQAHPVKKTAAQSPDLEGIIRQAAAMHNLDPSLIRAVISVESGGDTTAVSPKGAKGLMQLIDSTAAEVGVSDSFDPLQNVQGGAAYLKRMMDRYRGDRARALAAYNAGPGAVDRYGGVPPYPETITYIRKIMQQLNGGEGSATTAGQQGKNNETTD